MGQAEKDWIHRYSTSIKQTCDLGSTAVVIVGTEKSYFSYTLRYHKYVGWGTIQHSVLVIPKSSRNVTNM